MELLIARDDRTEALVPLGATNIIIRPHARFDDYTAVIYTLHGIQNVVYVKDSVRVRIDTIGDKMRTNPKEITVCSLEVVVMPNGEIICLGKTVGWVKTHGKFLTPKENA